jgi:hypothetical protein
MQVWLVLVQGWALWVLLLAVLLSGRWLGMG